MKHNHSWLDDIDMEILDMIAKHNPPEWRGSPASYVPLDEQDFACVTVEHDDDDGLWYETLVYRNMGLSYEAFQQHVMRMAIHIVKDHGMNVINVEYEPEILGCVLQN